MTWAAWVMAWLGMRLAEGTGGFPASAGRMNRAMGAVGRWVRSRRLGRDGRVASAWWRQAGQATTEYALVLLGVAAVAMALTTWAGGGKIGAFLDTVFDRMLTTAK